MASFSMPNVDGMNSVEELKNAVGKMAKELTWLMQNLDWKNINELNIQLNGGAAVTISEEGIVISDGTNVTFHADIDGKVTMTGATIQSASGYPKVVMDPSGNLFGAYASAASYLTINPVGSAGGSPQLSIVSPTGYMFLYQGGTDTNFNSGGDLRLNAMGDLELNLSGSTIVPFSQIYNFGSTVSLQDALNAKATKGISTSSSGSANGGIPIGTVLMVSGGGTVTWNGIPNHSHAQN